MLEIRITGWKLNILKTFVIMKPNNIYSVYLAKDYLLQDDTILIESDLIFDPQILDLLIENPVQSLVLVDKYKALDGWNGCKTC